MKTHYFPDQGEERTYYGAEPDQNLRPNLTVLERFLMELNHKQYYADDELKVILHENGLNYCDIYNKNCHYRKLLCAVLDVLESLANNIDVFRTIESEFGTTSEAYKYLERRIQRLQQRIDSIPDEPVLGGRDSDWTFIFRD